MGCLQSCMQLTLGEGDGYLLLGDGDGCVLVDLSASSRVQHSGSSIIAEGKYTCATGDYDHEECMVKMVKKSERLQGLLSEITLMHQMNSGNADKFIKPFCNNVMYGDKHQILINRKSPLGSTEGKVEDYVCICMEKGELSLREHCDDRKQDARFSESVVDSIAKDLIDMVSIAHSNGIVLLYFRPTNIVRVHTQKKGDVFKAIDFDSCCKVGSKIRTDIEPDSQYMSPEVANLVAAKILAPGTTITARKANDIFLLGLVLFQLYSSTDSLFPGKKLRSFWDVQDLTEDGDILATLTTLSSEDVKAVIDKTLCDTAEESRESMRSCFYSLLSPDPASRPTIETIKVKNLQSVSMSSLQTQAARQSAKDAEALREQMRNMSAEVTAANKDAMGAAQGAILEQLVASEERVKAEVRASADRICLKTSEGLYQLTSQCFKMNLSMEEQKRSLKETKYELMNMSNMIEQQLENENVRFDEIADELSKTRGLGECLKDSMESIRAAQKRGAEGQAEAVKLLKQNGEMLKYQHDVMTSKIDEMLRTEKQMVKMAADLHKRTNMMPTTFIIKPRISTKKLAKPRYFSNPFGNVIASASHAVDKLLWERSVLVFFCPVMQKEVECGPSRKGYEINVLSGTAKSMIRTIAPALKFGLTCVKIGLATQGLGALVPDVGNLLDDAGKGSSDHYSEMYFSHMIEDVTGTNPRLEDIPDVSKKLQAKEDALKRISELPTADHLGPIYHLVKKVEGGGGHDDSNWKPEHCGLVLYSDPNEEGRSKWVSKEGIQKLERMFKANEEVKAAERKRQEALAAASAL